MYRCPHLFWCFSVYSQHSRNHPEASRCFQTKKSEVFSESSQSSKMELFATIVNGWKPLTILAKSSILEVWLRLEYPSHYDSYVWKCRPSTYFEIILSIILITNRIVSSSLPSSTFKSRSNHGTKRCFNAGLSSKNFGAKTNCKIITSMLIEKIHSASLKKTRWNKNNGSQSFFKKTNILKA